MLVAAALWWRRRSSTAASAKHGLVSPDVDDVDAIARERYAELYRQVAAATTPRNEYGIPDFDAFQSRFRALALPPV